MNKKTLWISLALFPLLMIASFPSAAAVHISIPNQGHYIVESIGDPETVDPRWAYDTASGTVIFSVYEPLIRFGSYPVNPPAWQPRGYPEAVDQFDPALATSWTVENINELDPVTGFTWKQRYTFVIGGGGIPYIKYAGIAEGPNTVATDTDGEREGPANKYDGFFIYPLEGPNMGVPSLIKDTDGISATIDHAAFFPLPNPPTTDYVITCVNNPGSLTAYVKFGGIAEGPNVVASDTDNEREGPANKYDGLYFVPVEGANRFFAKLIKDTDAVIKTIDHAIGGADLPTTDYVLVTPIVPRFSNDKVLTTEDVEFSFESWMVQDRSGGPEWMIYEPTHGIGVYHADLTDPLQDEKIDQAIQHNATHVWINLVVPYPPFLSILAQTWASILNEAWCISHNDWPHDWSVWKNYHDPAHSPLDDPTNVMCGTGPYMLDYWTHGVEWSLVKNTNYWGGWPSAHGSRYFDRVTEKVVYEWGTRYADFVAGTADSVYVPRQYIPQLITNWPVPPGQWEQYATGIDCLKDLPQLAVDGIFFNFDINPASTYVGSGQLDGNGIPLDFFSDLNIRKAFAHLFDYKNYLKDVYLNEAEQPPSPHIKGLKFDNFIWNGGTLPNGTVLDGNATQAGIQGIPRYWLDWAKAKAYFIAASNTVGGPAQGVITKGFKMTITYNSGNQPRQVACQIYKTNVEKLFSDNGWGPVTISVTSVSWPTYLGELWFRPLYTSVMAIYMIGWLVDFPDPHNFVGPFQYSAGDFAAPSSYYNPTVDALIEEGIATTYEDYPGGGSPADPSDPLYNKRPAIYWKIAEWYFKDVPSICDVQALGRRWERKWVQGWYYNPIYPGMYPYHLWKGLKGDINGDNKVNILDAGLISAHWFTPPAPSGPLGYDPIADISPQLQYMGANPPVTKLPKDPATGNPAPSIGRVDIMDAAVVNAHWLEETP